MEFKSEEARSGGDLQCIIIQTGLLGSQSDSISKSVWTTGETTSATLSMGEAHRGQATAAGPGFQGSSQWWICGRSLLLTHTYPNLCHKPRTIPEPVVGIRDPSVK